MSPTFSKFINSRRALVTASFTFLAAMMVTALILCNRYLYYKEAERKQVQQIAFTSRINLESCLSNAAAEVQTLAYIIENYGLPRDFDALARSLVKDHSCVKALEIVQQGTITHIYPMLNNEGALGYNILRDTLVNREALEAARRDEVYFAGPLPLKQGGLGVVGRMPVVKTGKLFGFAAVVLDFRKLLKHSSIDTSVMADYEFQLVKTKAGSAKRQYFITPAPDFKSTVSASVTLPAAGWELRVRARDPVGWYELLFPLILGLACSLIISLFIAFIIDQPAILQDKVAKQTEELRKKEADLRDYIDRIRNQNKTLRELHWFQSHKIRAPLASLMGLADLLKSSDTLSEKDRKLAEYLSSCAAEFDAIIKQANKRPANEDDPDLKAP
jgi:sensor domain CHASE-containing protein